MGFCQQLQAQQTLQIQHQVSAGIERGNETILRFTVRGINSRYVRDAYLFYRINGDGSFRQKPAVLKGNTFEVPFEVSSPSATGLEYYFEIQLNSGEKIRYPANTAGTDILTTNIIDESNVKQSATGSKNEIDYTILSPEPEQKVSPEDVVIALTLFYEKSAVDTSRYSFRLLLDGRDITRKSRAGAYFFSYAPGGVKAGEHTAVLKLIGKDNTRTITSWTFTVSDDRKLKRPFADNDDKSFAPAGNLELTARNQTIARSSGDMLSGNARIYGGKNNIRYSAYGLLTSQADPRLQPQNRYGGELYIGKWLEVQAGHIYPVLSPMTVTGRRIEGVNAEISVPKTGFNVQFLHGQMRRGIANLYQRVTAHHQVSEGSIVDTSYSLAFRENGAGTYRQQVTGARMGYKWKNNFQMGVNLLKVQDDTTSMSTIRDANGLIQERPDLLTELSPAERKDLVANPDQFRAVRGATPKGNVVAETDMELTLDQRRIHLQADAAVSMVNNNIRGGAITAQRAEELGFNLDNKDTNLLKRLSWLIIINENMEADPFYYKDGESTKSANLRMPDGIWATESELYLNYFKNNIRIGYRRIGPDFASFANASLRQDVAGFTLSDRFRLLDDQIYITLGYENLDDNVTHYKERTISTVTLRSNLGWYPLHSGLPDVNLSLMKRSRKNGVGLYNPFVTSSHKTAAIQNYGYSKGEFTTIRMPIMRDSYQASISVSQQMELLGLTHDLNVNYGIYRTVEDLYAYGNEHSYNLSVAITNQFNSLPLNLHEGLNINQTDIGGLTNIRIAGLSLGGTLFLWKDKLNIDASLAFTHNYSEYTSLQMNNNHTPDYYNDDYYAPDTESTSKSKSSTYILNTGGRYNLNQYHALAVDLRLTNVIDRRVESPLPNDHFLQARYIYRF